MRKFFGIWIGTAFGPFLVWCGMAAALCAVMAFEFFLPEWLRIALVLSLAALLAAATLGALVALVVALVQKRWLRALVQLLLGAVSPFLFAIAFLSACSAGMSLAYATRTWYAAETADALPFAVEFIRTNPFLAEYDKRIAFASGKHIGLYPDTGGGGAFAVYRLASGGYWLVDGLQFLRHDYRVDAEAETVEMLCGGKWVPLPDGALKVTSHSSNGEIDVLTESGERKSSCAPQDAPPAEAALAERTFIGLVHPGGRFDPAAPDPLAHKHDDKLPKGTNE